jgi:hypothetical protein
MKLWYYIIICFSIFGYKQMHAQQQLILLDSIKVTILPKYDQVSPTHRKLLGENYRKEYGQQTTLPIISLSKISGGLKVTERGGGFQTRSLRLQDSSGREWTLRGVEKYPEILLPEGLRQTFLTDVLKDNMSAQHPFSALIVPVLCDAIGAPHSTPVIGWVAEDPELGDLGRGFAGTVCLLEEREPIGSTDNTAKMLRKLRADNGNSINTQLYLKLKCLDVLVGDWDRHDDQWRWRPLKSPDGLSYMPVPRDRDQVFYSSDGLVQRFAQGSWFLPMMQGYEKPISNINWFLWEGREINSKWFSSISRAEWDSTVQTFCREITDDVLEEALRKLPQPSYTQRHDILLARLKERRASMPTLMSEYYKFFNRIVDIELSDKNELVRIADLPEGGLSVTVKKTGDQKPNEKILYQRGFDPKVTREIRIYLHDGRDSVSIDTRNSDIRVRIIGGEGEKYYQADQAAGDIRVYGRTDNEQYSGAKAGRLIRHLSNDTSNTAYIPKDLYRRKLLFPNFGYNNDDGLALGLSLRFTSPGFRKQPYANSQSFSFLYSFATSAIKFYYTGEWRKAIGTADFVLQASAFAPSNTQNFFGLGNQTYFDESVDQISYYRARFNLYELSPALRWRTGRSIFSAGPTAQYYAYDDEENQGRFISLPSQLHSADSVTVSQDKAFVGAIVKYSFDSRDNTIIPVKGILLDMKLTAYEGLNSYSNAFGQYNLSLSVHQRLDSAANFVIAERIGGGVTAGRPAFYQSQFLGGQGNLLGYRQFRFAGEQSLYNNLELRVKLGNFVNYVLPGQVGLLGLYDVGRVWKRSEDSSVWHHGVGAGFYFAPASLSLLRLVASYSKEGWYPYFALSFRY